MENWQPVETAPRDGTPVYLRCEPRPDFGEHLLFWDAKKKRWAGYAFAVLGRVDTWWDESEPQPTHWKPATA